MNLQKVKIIEKLAKNLNKNSIWTIKIQKISQLPQ